MQQLEVLIMGQSYVLSCPPQSEALLQAAAARVDAVMCGIRDNGKSRARDRIAVLAAVNLAFELQQQPVATDSPVATDAVVTSLVKRLDEVLRTA